MQITIQNKIEDMEAFYDYVLRETAEGEWIGKRSHRAKQFSVIMLFLIIGLFVWSTSGSFISGLIFSIFFLFFLEFVILLISGFKPNYHYGKLALKHTSQNTLTADALQIYCTPRQLTIDYESIEIKAPDAFCRYKWNRISRIYLAKDFIFLDFSGISTIQIPKRDFASERDFQEFGQHLIGLRTNYLTNSQPAKIETEVSI